MPYIMRNGVAYGAGVTPTVLISTLAANATTVTFTDDAITGNERYNLYVENNPYMKCSDVTVSGHTLTATFPAPSDATRVKLVINENTNGSYQELKNLPDVSITTPAEGDNLVYDSSNGVWVNSSGLIETQFVSCIIGDTSCTIVNSNIHTTSYAEVIWQKSSSTPVYYSELTLSEGSATITFPALTEATDFQLWIKN